MPSTAAPPPVWWAARSGTVSYCTLLLLVSVEIGRSQPQIEKACIVTMINPSIPLPSHSGTNGEFKRLFGAESSRPLSGPFLFAAACTGLAEALVFTPIDLVKTRCQVKRTFLVFFMGL